MRGSVMAMYSVLDDLSKGFGTLFVSMIVRLVGGRAVAYQLSLLLWVFTGVALLYTWHTYEEDEAAMRKNLDEAAKESMVLMSKHRAQQAIRDRAKAAGAAHLQLKSEKPRGSEYSWGFWTQSSKPPSDCSTSASQPGNNSDTASTHSSSSSSRGRGRPPLSAAAAASAAEQRDRLRRAARAAAEAAAHVR